MDQDNKTGTETEKARSDMRHATPPGEKQRFVKNDQYFTVCIYIFVLVAACTVIIKAIVDIPQTKAFLGSLIRAVGPFLIALLIAYLLNPFVKAIYRLIHRLFPALMEKPAMMISLLIVYLTGIGLVITLLLYVIPEIVINLGELVNGLSEVYDRLLEGLAWLQRRFPQVDLGVIVDMLEDTRADLTDSLTDIAKEIAPVLYTASVSVMTWASNFLIALIVSVYILYGKASLKRLVKIVLYGFVPKERLSEAKKTVRECNRIFSSYITCKMIDAFLVGILCALFMMILRLPYIPLISVVVGISNMIPYFGPFIGAVPGTVILLCVNPVQALVFSIMIFCLQQIDGLILEPKLLGSSTGMKPLWIIFAITIGGKFFGIAGMFLGVPVLATFSYLCEGYFRKRLAQKGISIDNIR